MAPQLHILTYAVAVELTVAEEVVEQQIGFLPWVLGENLAGQVDSYVAESGLGYYPALDFFRQRPEIVDPDLLILVDQVAIFCGEYARRELKHRLSRSFSSVGFGPIQSLAYTMPRIRPQQRNSPHALAEHYSPNRLKVELHLSMIQKGAFDALEQLMEDNLLRWGKEAFVTFRIASRRRLGEGAGQ